jgi:hypothetical protein
VVNQKCTRFHVLHATAYNAERGTRVGALHVHYENGHKWEIPIVYGDDVLDWWFDPRQQETTSRSTVVWTGENPATKRGQQALRLFKSTWDSPLPVETVEHITYRSTGSASAPFLVAITVE